MRGTEIKHTHLCYDALLGAVKAVANDKRMWWKNQRRTLKCQ